MGNKPVLCGSDGHVYRDYCEMVTEACKIGDEIKVAPINKCHRTGKLIFPMANCLPDSQRNAKTEIWTIK